MNPKGLLLLLLPVVASGFSLCPFYGDCSYSQYTANSEARSTSWLTMVSCTANQVPTLPNDFTKPLYQYLFEVFAKNTHLLPLGVPMQSKSEDFETTAAYEKCLWGDSINLKENGIRRNDLLAERTNDSENDIDGEVTDTEESAYQQLFASRQGGYDSLTGFSLLGGKIVAAMIGYIIYTLTG